MSKTNLIGIWTLGFSVVIATVFGASSCVRRDWQFENACREAGGFVANAATVSGAQTTRNEVCAKVIQPSIIQPIPLPGYTK